MFAVRTIIHGCLKCSHFSLVIIRQRMIFHLYRSTRIFINRILNLLSFINLLRPNTYQRWLTIVRFQGSLKAKHHHVTIVVRMI